MKIIKAAVVGVFLSSSALSFAEHNLLSFESDEPDIRGNIAVHEFLNHEYRQFEYANRVRVATVDAHALVSGKNKITLNVFDDTKFVADKAEVKYSEDLLAYAWTGYIQSDEYSRAEWNKLLSKKSIKTDSGLEISTEYIKRALLGVQFTIEEYGTDKSTGETMRTADRVFHGSKYLGDDPAEVVTSRIKKELKRNGGPYKHHDRFLVVDGRIKVPNSSVYYLITPVVGSPNHHVIAEFDSERLPVARTDTVGEPMSDEDSANLRARMKARKEKVKESIKKMQKENDSSKGEEK